MSTNPNEMVVDVGDTIQKWKNQWKVNIIVGICFIWFIPVGLIVLIQSIRMTKKSPSMLVENVKKVYDGKAARQGKTVKYINIPSP